ncbi:MAG: hypothetical protein HFJ45_04585, partial [Clostridia bacterium]|nr:hypothetical protein [Clostridia bacterium]
LGGAYKPSYVVIELDKPRYVAEVDYVPDAKATGTGGYPTGKASKLEIYVSMDSTNWELAAVGNNLANNNNLKKITFEEAKQAKYVKIHCPSVYQSGLQHYFSIAVINLYENPSASEIPTAEISYNITNKTNKDVIAELVDENRPITVTNNDGSKTHTFTENGEFTFEFVDDEGNKGSATANVDWIDKIAPEAEVTFSTTELTNEDVVATITFSKENITVLSKDVQIAENPVDKSKTITFEANASYELEFADELGNVGTKTIAVDWIDKEAPTAELTYSTLNLTDQPVIVTMNPSEEVTVLNNNGEMSYTFEENGTFTFEFVDRAGNAGTAIANVNWISKIPEYTLTYSTTEPTNQDVTVTLELEEGYRIVSDNGANTHTFTENGEFTFEYIDESGNRGVILVSVNWIDKTAPQGVIKYNIMTATNQTVKAILIPNEEVEVTNNNGSTEYTFTQNGNFTFEFRDKAGNVGNAVATVDWIDKEAPTAEISYSITGSTKEDVIATLVNESEEITITNNNGSKEYTFTENGTFTFKFVDKAGNVGSATAKVTWINKNSGLITSEKYKIENDFISQIRPKLNEKEGTTVKEFKENIDAKEELIVSNKDGIKLDDNNIVTTGSKLKVGEKEYIIIVKGDIDCDGEITINDLAKIKLHYIEKKLLEEIPVKAADIDGDEEITINDLAVFKLLLIGLRELN